MVNCTGAPNCTALHRASCSKTAGTCGSCLSGYSGILIQLILAPLYSSDDVAQEIHSLIRHGRASNNLKIYYTCMHQCEGSSDTTISNSFSSVLLNTKYSMNCDTWQALWTILISYVTAHEVEPTVLQYLGQSVLEIQIVCTIFARMTYVQLHL